MQSNDRKSGGAVMEKTRHPGIYKRGSRYVVVWRHRGKQHKSFHRTLAEAREAKGGRQAGESTPATRANFEDYAREWLNTYRGRTDHGVGETTMASYRQAIEHDAIPFFGRFRLAEVTPPDVRRFVRHLEKERGLAPSSVVKTVAPLRAMFATAVEDGAIRSNPTSVVRVSRRREESEEASGEERAKAMTRAQLAALLEELPGQWRMFFELLAKTGLRIPKRSGSTGQT